LEQEINAHIKVTTKTCETEYEIPCISCIYGRLWVVSVCMYVCACVCVCVYVTGVPRCTVGSLPGLFEVFSRVSV